MANGTIGEPFHYCFECKTAYGVGGEHGCNRTMMGALGFPLLTGEFLARTAVERLAHSSRLEGFELTIEEIDRLVEKYMELVLAVDRKLK